MVAEVMTSQMLDGAGVARMSLPMLEFPVYLQVRNVKCRIDRDREKCRERTKGDDVSETVRADAGRYSRKEHKAPGLS